MTAAASPSLKTDVSPELCDNSFAPSSCLVLITHYDGRDEEFRAGESWRDAYKSTD
jgi:hypothetical protein